MSLEDLGFDDWFRSRLPDPLPPGEEAARVVAVHRGACRLRSARAEAPAVHAGRLLHEAHDPSDLPAVGDWVRAEFGEEGARAVVRGILPRRSSLVRKAAGRSSESQVLAANVDRALLVQSLEGDFNPRRLERYLVMAIEGGIVPVVLLSKVDLLPPGLARERAAAVGALHPGTAVLPCSARTGEGLEAVRAATPPRSTCCLLGSSGVGKTTLLNLLAGREVLPTAEIAADGRGRHTTTARQLFALPSGALLVDTPGMRELGTLGSEESLAGSFREIAELGAACRYRDCTHTAEAGCAVRDALERGAIDAGRYEGFLKLRREAEFNRMSDLERRRRDKEFGKLCKSVMKERRSRR